MVAGALAALRSGLESGMTYFSVLATFLVPPLLLLVLIVWREWRFGVEERNAQIMRHGLMAVVIHVVIAVIYTTPWDNYLVATRVWWYDSELVTGITLGWVPIEEYAFFVLQTLFTGLWTLVLFRFLGERLTRPVSANTRVRSWVTGMVFALWLVSTLVLLAGGESWRYLTLILSWALLPVLLQLAFGTDILLANWRLLTLAILIPTLYLWMVDALAISSGTWTIDPRQTTGLKVGVLPIEEMLFFLMADILIAFGITL
ncbi:MAG: lycopene cyclase domain-containing protein, partial [Taibaiella sp.]|nr:lycopene cyclase domain-containing protein [Taibaiella sp.]